MALERTALDKDALPSGYTRTAFSARFWALSALLVLLAMTAVFLFPSRTSLVLFFVEKGQWRSAQKILGYLLEAQPHNGENLLLAADLEVKLGRPDLAIQHLQKALGQGAPPTTTLSRLITLYEWTQQPQKAMETLEQLHLLSPEDPKVLRRLLAYYRRYGLWEQETRALVQLVRLERKIPPPKMYGWIEGEAVRQKLMKDPWVGHLRQTLWEITQAMETHPEDVRFQFLLRTLYYLRTNYESNLEARGADYQVDPTALVDSAAEAFLEAGLVDQAMDFFTEWDHIRQGGAAARLRFAHILAWSGLADEARQVLSTLVHAPQLNPEEFLAIASLARQLPDPELAILSLQKARERFPDDTQIALAQARLLMDEGRPVEAWKRFKSVIAKEPKNLQAIEGLLTAAQDSGDQTLLAESLPFADQLRPEDPQWIRLSAQVSLRAGDPNTACKKLRSLFAAGLGTEDDFWLLVQAARASGRREELLQAAQVAEKLGEKDPQMLRDAAFLFMEANAFESAYDLFSRLLESAPNDTDLLTNLVFAARQSGKPQLKEDAVLRILQMASAGRLSIETTEEALSQLGAGKKAIHLYEELAARRPDPLVIQSLVRLYRWNGQPGKAADLLARISDKRPADPQAAMEAGKAYVQADRVDRAVVYLERALRGRPGDVRLRRSLATYYGWLGRMKDRMRHLEVLHKLGALPKEDYPDLAFHYLDRGAAQRARDLLLELSSMRALTVNESLALASAHELAGSPDLALNIYRSLAAQHPHDPDLLATLGNHALWLDQMEVALDFYERALRQDPNNLVALKGSAQIYAWNNDPQRAIARFEHYNRLNPLDFEVHYQLGELYHANGRQGAAFQEYRKAERLIRRVRRGERR
ncbi:Tetratricopeptide repeat-containing protein [Desulfacinum hydrothermale DSM 13146]|uniref:Tetratricopeptide repeat-containing protein n=1 Tax=Desulfacinum hydrothermale DSM 13146 TaxID=1121390 RepID=A0A1W1X810_9BACT|nr:tetratricopeptide repeat protein [Desulfacinum hydrothermale]SMC20102.1 Tetratricopeptide repeat-containing protein [Desulfacinum hydrothermale DSM 13146]